jgi:hypothetical protein
MSTLGSSSSWDQFIDFDGGVGALGGNHDSKGECFESLRERSRALSLPIPKTSPPMYIVESSVETQQLWYETAGQRPKQPEHERKYFERIWAKNFESSKVDYSVYSSDNATTPTDTSAANKPVSDVQPTATGTGLSSVVSTLLVSSGDKENRLTQVKGTADPKSLIGIPVTDKIPHNEFDYKVLFRGRGPFSKSVSKSFPQYDNFTITLQVPKYRVVEDVKNGGGTFAEFLIVVSLGSASEITMGVWKRHSSFQSLVNEVRIGWLPVAKILTTWYGRFRS